MADDWLTAGDEPEPAAAGGDDDWLAAGAETEPKVRHSFCAHWPSHWLRLVLMSMPCCSARAGAAVG